MAFFEVAMREGEREELKGVEGSNYSDGSSILPGGIGRWGQEGMRMMKKEGESWLDGLGRKDGLVQLGFQKVRAGVKVESGSAEHGGGPVRWGARALEEGRLGTKSLEPWTGHLCGY